jgi:hypothetical protein
MTNNRSAGDHAPHATTGQPAPDAGLGIRAGMAAPGTAKSGASKGGTAENGGSKGGTAENGTAESGKEPEATGAPGKRRVRWGAARQQGRRARRSASAAAAGTAGKVAAPQPGPERVVRIGSPASLLALVPQLLGFQPRESIVVMGVEPPRGRVQLTLRFDLRGAPDPGVADLIARHLLGVMTAQGIKAGVAVGYGAGCLVTPVADALRAYAAQVGFRLTELLRAQDGRYWSYLCTEPACCPAEGVPYDVAGHPVTAAFAAAGAPPVLADRAELVASVVALDGAAGESMQEATRQAEERATRLIAQVIESGRKGAARRLIAAAGLDAVSEAITRYAAGGEFTCDADAAWLSLVLRDLRVRDDAWSRMDPGRREMYLRLWTDLTRRARPGYVAPAASLLAFAAWQCGNGALANIALDRALADDPGYSMARLLRQVIDAGVPPRLARLPMTPQDVAASYDAGDPAAAGPGRDASLDPGTGDGGDAGPEFGDADFGDPGYDPGYDDWEAGGADEEEIARPG